METLIMKSMRVGKALSLQLLVGMLLTGCATLDTSQVERPEELTNGLSQLRNGQFGELSLEADAFEVSNVADTAYEQENWAVAEKYYRRLTRQVPQDGYGYFRLGNVLMQQAKIDKAINAYNQSLTRDPDNVKALKNRSLAYLLRTELLLEETVKMLEMLNDDSAKSYSTALLSLRNLNELPMNETVSPLDGLYTNSIVTLEEMPASSAPPSGPIPPRFIRLD